MCIAARLCQIVVISAHSHTLNPTNEDLAALIDGTWNILTTLWETPDIEEGWFNIADNYLKQSVK